MPFVFVALSSQVLCLAHASLASSLALNVPLAQASHFAAFAPFFGTNFLPAAHFVTGTKSGLHLHSLPTFKHAGLVIGCFTPLLCPHPESFPLQVPTTEDDMLALALGLELGLGLGLGLVFRVRV